MKVKFSLSTGLNLAVEAKPTERLMNVVSRLFDENPKHFQSKELGYCLVNGQKANLIKSLKENKITNDSMILLVVSDEEDLFEEIENENIKKAIDTFKSELQNIHKEDDTKKINFELKSGEPKGGISFELFTVETKGLFKYINTRIDYIKNSFSILSIQFKVKSLEHEKAVKTFYDMYEDKILEKFAEKKLYDLSLNYRAEGTNIFIEVVSQNRRYIKTILSFGLDPSKLGEYSLSMGYKTNLKVSDLFSNKTLEEIVSLFYEFIIYLKGESKNLNYIVDAAINAMNTINLTNKEFQKKLDEYLKFISIAMDLLSANTEIKVLPKYVIKETVKQLKDIYPEQIKNCNESKKNILKGLYDNWKEMYDLLKAVNFDSIDICYGIPNKQVGLLTSIRFPGLYSALHDDIEI